GVVSRALVGVLAVAEVGDLRQRKRERLGKRLDVEPPRDRRLVGGRGGERLGRESTARLERQLAGALQLLQQPGIARRSANRSAVSEVLRGAAQHRRAADVDHLDGLLLANSVAARNLAEGIEVDADQVEWADVVLIER